MSMNTSRQVSVSALVLLLAAAAPVRSEEPTRGSTRELRSTLATAVNPVGLQEGLDASWRRSLSTSGHALLKDAHLSFGVSPRLTPAYARVGAWIQVAPLSVLELRAGFEPVAYFGTFSSLLYFDGYDARFDSDARRARRGEARPALAGRAYLAPTLKAKAGRVALRAHAELEWWRARQQGAFFYEPARDTLLRASGDSLVTADALALYELGSRGGSSKRYVGAAYDLTWARAAHENRRQTVGVVGVWSLGAKRLGLHQPTLFGKVFSYLEDPYKTKQLGAQFALSFSIRPASAR